MKNGFTVAIDGPAGSGKSSVAKALCERFSFLHFDSGACYRAVASYFLSKGITDKVVIEDCELDDVITLEYDEESILLNGKRVGNEIRTPQVSGFSSDISTIKNVREFVTKSIRDMIKGYDVIMDGRDIGTVVLPNADLKIFLTATARERASRRLMEWQSNGEQLSLEQVIKEIERRDYRDMNRELSPLKTAEDAVTIDTTLLTFQEVVEKISDIIMRKREG